MDYIFHIIGFVGACLVCFAYFKTTNGDWLPDSDISLKTNIGGAVLLTLSLLVNFNFGSFLIEIFWISISIKAWRKRS